MRLGEVANDVAAQSPINRLHRTFRGRGRVDGVYRSGACGRMEKHEPNRLPVPCWRDRLSQWNPHRFIVQHMLGQVVRDFRPKATGGKAGRGSYQN